MRKADAILSADWHLREDQPEAWTADYQLEQGRVLDFIRDLQRENDCPVLVAGDIFDRHGASLQKWVSPGFLRFIMKRIPNQVICVPGQHDLPQHNLSLYSKCALAALEQAGRIRTLLASYELHEEDLPGALTGFPFGEPLHGLESSEEWFLPHIALVHAMTFRRRKPYPGCTAPNGNALMGMMPGFDLIVTGDNHQPFTIPDGDRLLVNPGSLMRMTAAQIDHQPRVYLWYAEDNTVEAVFIPQLEDCISREHIDKEVERDTRIAAFVEALGEDVEVGLSFEENLKEFMSSNNTKRSVQDIVWKAVEA